MSKGVLFLLLLVMSTCSNGSYRRKAPNAVNTSTCGLTKDLVVSRRIVGGRKALKEEFPYQVALEKKSPSGQWKPFCGGSIVADTYVVTAAHCMNGEKLSDLRIVAGTIHLDEATDHTMKVDKVIKHEDWNPYSMENDIALIKTTGSMSREIDSFTNSICLPDADFTFSGVGTITGYGNTKEDGMSSRSLLASYLDIMDDTSCNQKYGSWNYKPSSMMCAGYDRGGRDTCQGDSGGPIAQRINSRWTLIGITSFGDGCGRPKSPGVYTRVTSFVNWIKLQTKKHG